MKKEEGQLAPKNTGQKFLTNFRNSMSSSNHEVS
jgi:hypothetical protein